MNKIKSVNFILPLFLMALILQSCEDFYEYPPTSTNAQTILSFRNYLGNTQNIHPKVLYFPEKWKGYKFWMAYTPYPKGKTDAENPCIAVSQNGLDWTAPGGLKNPLAYAPKNGYNSDTHLLYDSDNDRMECWWREYDSKTNRDSFYRRISTDGIHWDEKEKVMEFALPGVMRLSPAVWIADGVYKLIYSNGARLFYIESPISKVGKVWSDPTELPIKWSGLHAWHHDVIQNSEGDLELVVCAFGPGGNNNAADLYYVKVRKDLSEATQPVLILQRGRNKNDFDYKSIYRSSLVYVDDQAYLYYSAIDRNWTRSISLMHGPSVFELTGLTYDDFIAAKNEN